MTDYDASNKRHIAVASRAAKADDDARRVFINTIMGVASGRAYVHDLLVYCHVFAQPFAADPHDTSFRCGQLDVGQVLLRDIMSFCPDNYVTMMREANVRSSTNAARFERSDKDVNGRDSEPGHYVHPAFREAGGDDRPADTDANTDYNPVDQSED